MVMVEEGKTFFYEEPWFPKGGVLKLKTIYPISFPPGPHLL